ncbi:MAG: sigma-70 family RNA polymerase sigma factor [Candidatus Omnitrophica bacterium]|nr:sigma-70 family RNA polymerase sigma factor [Candidatus Omnitrophota bacterium]
MNTKRKKSVVLENSKEGKFQEIIELGRKKKHLSWDEINEILPADLTGQDDILELFDELDYWDIDIDEEEPFPIEKEEEKKLDLGEARNPLRSYLKCAGTYSLLTHEEEVTIARGIEESKSKLQKLYKKKSLNRKECEKCEKELMELKAQLINSNLRLVINIAKRYNNPKLSILDLIQEGNIGLMKAVEKFKYRTGFKFSTYATWWIRQAITRAIADHSAVIRTPVHMIEKQNKMKKIEAHILQSKNDDPTEEEIAKKMHLSINKVRTIQRSMKPDPVSLDMPVGDEERTTIGDFIEDNKNPDPLKHARHALLREELEKALKALDEREEKILRLRFGLDEAGYQRTLEEVGNAFQLTRERIRQIEAKAIQKLKHSAYSKKLKLFMDGVFEGNIQK